MPLTSRLLHHLEAPRWRCDSYKPPRLDVTEYGQLLMEIEFISDFLSSQDLDLNLGIVVNSRGSKRIKILETLFTRTYPGVKFYLTHLPHLLQEPYSPTSPSVDHILSMELTPLFKDLLQQAHGDNILWICDGLQGLGPDIQAMMILLQPKLALIKVHLTSGDLGYIDQSRVLYQVLPIMVDSSSPTDLLYLHYQSSQSSTSFTFSTKISLTLIALQELTAYHILQRLLGKNSHDSVSEYSILSGFLSCISDTTTKVEELRDWLLIQIQ